MCSAVVLRWAPKKKSGSAGWHKTKGSTSSFASASTGYWCSKVQSHTVILYQAGVRKAAKETPAKAVVMVNPGIPSQASKPCRAAIIRAVRCQVAPARTCLRRDLVGSDCGTGKLKGYKAIRLYFMTDLGSYKR